MRGKTVNQPVLILDLFCGAGGACRGYQVAGFAVVGVDLAPQKRYVGEDFVQMDALAAMDELLNGGAITGRSGRKYRLSDFAAIHASPPCQFASMATRQWRASGRDYPNLIAATRERLIRSSLPSVIENVPGAPLINPVILNGALFGLRIRRTRWFEPSFPIPFILLPREEPAHFRMGRPVRDGDSITPVGHFSNVAYARRVMGCPWMTRAELSQAIPPAYTCWIGVNMMQFIAEEEGREA